MYYKKMYINCITFQLEFSNTQSTFDNFRNYIQKQYLLGSFENIDVSQKWDVKSSPVPILLPVVEPSFDNLWDWFYYILFMDC